MVLSLSIGSTICLIAFSCFVSLYLHLSRKLGSKPVAQERAKPDSSFEEENEDENDFFRSTRCSTPTPLPSDLVSNSVGGNKASHPGVSSTAASSAYVSSATSRKAKEPGQRKKVSREALLEQLSQTTSHTSQLQNTVADLLSGQNDSMAKGYGTFLSTFVPSLHPTLLTNFYQDSWQLLMRYHMESERLKQDEEQQRKPTVRPTVNKPVLQGHPQPSPAQPAFSQC